MQYIFKTSQPHSPTAKTLPKRKPWEFYFYGVLHLVLKKSKITNTEIRPQTHLNCCCIWHTETPYKYLALSTVTGDVAWTPSATMRPSSVVEHKSVTSWCGSQACLVTVCFGERPVSPHFNIMWFHFEVTSQGHIVGLLPSTCSSCCAPTSSCCSASFWHIFLGHTTRATGARLGTIGMASHNCQHKDSDQEYKGCGTQGNDEVDSDTGKL